jgi:hypothetical protein
MKTTAIAHTTAAQRRKQMRVLTASALLIGAVFTASRSDAAVDLGNASVMSQQGQKLKVAVAYGGELGEKVSAVRFVVDEVNVPAGFSAPPANSLTVLKPANRNVVYVQSTERFDAPNLQLVMRVAGTGGSEPTRFNLVVPAARLAAVDSDPSPAAKSMKNGKTPVKRGQGKKSTSVAMQAAPAAR